MKHTQVFCIIFFLLIGPALSGAGSNSDISRRLEILVENVTEQEQLLNRLRGKYLSSRMSFKGDAHSAETMIKRAEYFFEKEDYITSESIYYSIFSSLRYDKNSMWEKVAFRLAESLFLNKNYISAVRYYEILLSSKPDTEFKIPAIKRLIASSYHLGQYSKAKTYYSDFRDVGYDISQDRDLIYFLGKSLFFDGEYEQAMEIFSTIGPETEQYPQSLYFLGAISVEIGEFEKAAKMFRSIIELRDDTGVYRDLKKIRELAILAVARIHFEKGEFHKAVGQYLELDYKSDNFVRAYYELCWAYIKREKYQKAIDALRMIKYISPNEIISPRAVLLEGNLLIKLKRYGDAMVLFDSVVNSYAKTTERLSNLKRGSFLSDVEIDGGEGILVSFPVMVQSVLRSNNKFHTALSLRDKISSLNEDIKRTENLRKEVKSIIRNKNTASIFPPLKRGNDSVVAILNKVSAYSNRLLKIRRNLTYSMLTDTEKKQYDILGKEKETLLRKINGLPYSREEITEKKKEYVSKLLQMEQDVHLQSIELKGMYESLRNMKSFYERKFPDAAGREKTIARIEKEKKILRALITDIETSRDDLTEKKNELRLRGALLDSMSVVRERYEKIINRQDAILARYADKTHSVDDRAQNARERINSLRKNAESFRVKLNDIVKGKVANIRKIYENEQRKIDKYKSELMNLRKKVSEMATLAMYSNINNVRETFSDIVLQADLGIIDVAWQRKEDASKKILKLRMKRSREIKRIRKTLENLQ